MGVQRGVGPSSLAAWVAGGSSFHSAGGRPGWAGLHLDLGLERADVPGSPPSCVLSGNRPMGGRLLRVPRPQDTSQGMLFSARQLGGEPRGGRRGCTLGTNQAGLLFWEKTSMALWAVMGKQGDHVKGRERLT